MRNIINKIIVILSLALLFTTQVFYSIPFIIHLIFGDRNNKKVIDTFCRPTLLEFLKYFTLMVLILILIFTIY